MSITLHANQQAEEMTAMKRYQLIWKSGNVENFARMEDIEWRLMNMTRKGLDYIARISVN
jgi:hypothetical protein